MFGNRSSEASEQTFAHCPRPYAAGSIRRHLLLLTSRSPSFTDDIDRGRKSARFAQDLVDTFQLRSPHRLNGAVKVARCGGEQYVQDILRCWIDLQPPFELFERMCSIGLLELQSESHRQVGQSRVEVHGSSESRSNP